MYCELSNGATLTVGVSEMGRTEAIELRSLPPALYRHGGWSATGVFSNCSTRFLIEFPGHQAGSEEEANRVAAAHLLSMYNTLEQTSPLIGITGVEPQPMSEPVDLDHGTVCRSFSMDRDKRPAPDFPLIETQQAA